MSLPRLCFVLVASLSQLATAKTGAATAQLSERTDTEVALGDIACANGGSALPTKAWESGVFDAQIEGRRVAGEGSFQPTPKQMQRTARSLARVKRYHGFAAGLCPDKTGWAVAMPSASGLKKSGNAIALPLKSLEAECESWRVDHAPTASEKPKKLAPETGGRVKLAPLGDGVLSVTCQPKSPRWLGPVLWFLAPTGKGPEAMPPGSEGFTETSDAAESLGQLTQWVNKVRLRAGEKPIIFSKELSDEASILAIDSSLAHNRQLLARVGKSLDGQKTKLLGENRVRGHDVKTMAWLLWNSPRHRDLLLSSEATVAGIAQRDIRGERLTVLVFASEAPLVTVKAPTKKSKKSR